MKLTKKIKKMVPITLAFSMMIVTMSGCTYVNNKSWNDMTPEEQEEVRQAFDEAKSDLEANDLGNSLEDDFARYILNKVEQALENDH